MKSTSKLFKIVVLMAIIGFLMIGCDLGGNDSVDNGNDGGGNTNINPSITIKNSTGYSTTAWSTDGLWIKPSTTAQSWGNNFAYYFGDEILDGQSRTCTLSQSLSNNNVYDIRLNAGGFSFRKYGVTVSNKMTITFTTSDLNDGSSQPTILIQNRSGKSFDSVYIKPSVISNWGDSFGTISNNADLSATILIPPSDYTVFDIQMKSTNPTNTYTRSNITILQGMTLTFTSADMDNPTIELPVIVIQNSTGYSTTAWSTDGLWIKASSSTNWGTNLAYYFGDEMTDGLSRAYSLSQHLSAENLYDIRLIAGGFTFVKNNITVSEGMIIKFTASDLQ